MTEWYRHTVKETLEKLNSDSIGGLVQREAEARLLEYGKNELQGTGVQTIWGLFFGQFKDFLVLLLIGAAVISLLLGEVIDAVVILLIVLLNAALGVIQEHKAEKTLEALKTLSAPIAKAIRDGELRQVSADSLVPGDLILLEAGDYVPADARLVETVNLKVDESALTGESVPVEKEAGFIGKEDLPIGDWRNVVHMGTMTTFGRARAVVVATGMRTGIGKIASLIQEETVKETPLQRKLAEFGRQLALLALSLCALIFFLGVFRGNQVFEMFFTAVSLAVAAVPEGLPAIVTIVLALGVQRMAGQKAIIRKLPAVETLGSATVICSDKTGTLTRNEMTVRKILTGYGCYDVTGAGYEAKGEFLQNGKLVSSKKEPYLDLILLSGVLCSDARLSAEGDQRKMIGDPTEGALVAVGEKAGLLKMKEEKNLPRLMELPFDSTRKRMSTVHQGDFGRGIAGLPEEGRWLFVKGAPDTVLDQCDRWLGPNGVEELSFGKREEFLKHNSKMAGEALRVLAFAFRPFGEGESLSVEESERDLILIGFMGMIDPPRSEAKEAIKVCKRAGINVIMITGDHPETAWAVAKELGMAVEEEQVITGSQLDRLSQEELEEEVRKVTVFARVSPEHKVRIVDALRKNGNIVAMTGDGVNDAPALKRADIGAAMGITGTDVAKEAAQMVLADDNFVTIVGAVKEGRIIFENIKKAIYFLLSCNAGEILTIFVAILLGWPIPLLPIQILWVNLITDSLPALSLGVDPPEDEVMKRRPRDPEEGIFGPGIKATLPLFGVFIALITLIAFRFGMKVSVSKGQTMAFATLGMSQLFHVFNLRSLYNSIFGRGILGNKSLLWSVLLSGLLQLAVLYLPFLMRIFRVAPLEAFDLLLVVGLSASPILFGEIWKALWMRRYRR